MIKYAVQCQKGHGFEAWFQNSDACEKQIKRGMVACPDCGSIKVSKSLMAPNVSARTRKKGMAGPVARSETARAVATATATQKVATPTVAMPAELVEMMRKIRREVVAKAENVGKNFAEEARKIHYEEAPERGIYGEASLDDVQALHDEGISVLPLPVLPEDAN